MQFFVWRNGKNIAIATKNPLNYTLSTPACALLFRVLAGNKSITQYI